MSVDHDDRGFHEHDLGLGYDLSTLVRRRQALKLFAGGALAALVGCASSKSTSSNTSASNTTSSGASSTAGTTASTNASTTAAATSSTAATAATTTASPTSATQASSPTSVSTSTEPTSVAPAADVSSAIPEETAGPFPGDGSNGKNALNQSGIVRNDIRSSFGSSSTVADGVLYTMKFQIVSVGTGAPVAGAAVYVWHCDVDGNYSMYSQGVTNENYLRGVQETDANGNVSFVSIFPGCYSGRWPHVHYEVYPSLAKATSSSSKVATSQLALPEDACKLVYAADGYATSVRNLSRVSLATDNVFRDGATRETPIVTGDVAAGMVSTIVVPVSV